MSVHANDSNKMNQSNDREWRPNLRWDKRFGFLGFQGRWKLRWNQNFRVHAVQCCFALWGSSQKDHLHEHLLHFPVLKWTSLLYRTSMMVMKCFGLRQPCCWWTLCSMTTVTETGRQWWVGFLKQRTLCVPVPVGQCHVQVWVKQHHVLVARANCHVWVSHIAVKQNKYVL